MTATTVEPKQFVMMSVPMADAPSILRFAINGYKFKRDRKKMLNIVKSWEGPSDEVYRRLLNGEIEWTVDDALDQQGAEYILKVAS
jgi:hypothetical protein